MAIFGGKAKPASYRTPRAITSAAAPVRLRDKSELEKLRHQGSVSRAWQLETWRVYDNLGEVNYAFNLVAAALSRVRIHAAVVLNPDEPPTEVTDSVAVTTLDGEEVGAPGGIDPVIAVKAREYIANLNTGDGIPSLLRAYALNKNTTGECYLCLLKDEWSIRSTFELMVDPSGGMRLQPSASTQTALPEEIPRDKSTVIRMWTRHPQYSADPDCSLRSVLFLCEQLIKLNRMINNAIQSRMNAGILQVASEILEANQTPGTEGNVDNPDEVETEGFQADLNAAMTQPILDDQSGAGVIPLVVSTPHELMDGIRWISLARDVDQHMITYAENLLTRILNGIPIPKDAITGFQNVRFANAQAISEEFFKQAVEPLAVAFCDDITSAYLQPLMQAKAAAEGWPLDEVKKLVAWYDPSEIVTRPDRGADADAGWDRGALSDDAWRKAHGFGAEDAPSVEEKLMREVVKNPQLPPNLVDYLARELLPQFFKGAPPLVTKAQAGMDEAATTPLEKSRQPSPQPRSVSPDTTDNPAGSDDQTPPPGGTLPPRAQQ